MATCSAAKTCVAEATVGNACAIHAKGYRRVESSDLAAGRVCHRCQRKLVKGEWIVAGADGVGPDVLVHAKACKWAPGAK